MELIKFLYSLILNEVIFKAIILSLMTLIITFSHSYTYNYLLNKTFIFTSLMLAPLVLAVTVVISTNLYLSLGMIGALSIVRYRTPVKSQYELALFFSFICLGIISGVNFILSVKVFLFLVAVPIFYELIFKKIFTNKIIKKNLDQSNNIIIEALIHDKDTGTFIKRHNLKNNIVKIETNNETKETLLLLEFNEIDVALEYKNNLEKLNEVKSINLNYA